MTDIAMHNDRIATIGMDLGKRSFHLIGMDARGKVIMRQQLSRGRFERHMANLQPCLVGVEACAGAHHIGRRLSAFGHNVRLIPAQYVKPFRKGQKNDYRDAEAIAEAVQRPTMRFVPIKSAEQLDLQALHRIRSRLVGHRTAVINQLRGFLLECGVIVPQGPAMLRKILPSVLAQRTDVLSPRMIRLIEELADDWRRLDDRVDAVTSEVQALARQDEGCRRLMSVPGIGALTASAVVATIGNGAAFTKGATSEPGSGWCRNNSPQATERYSAGSANAVTSTCAPYSSSGLAPCWQSPAAGRSLALKDGWQVPPSGSIITS